MFKNTFESFFRLESAGGILLLVAAGMAMVLSNSALGPVYDALLNVPIQIRVGPLNINKPLFLWVNDGLMALFFFTIGMEVKREVMVGELSDIRQIILPGMAGLGGIILPAIVYFVLNADNEVAMQGWAIPTATDIAFALGILALVGNVPTALKLFLMTLAIIDDLGAILIIAAFYTTDLSIGSLIVALLAVWGLVWLKLRKTTRALPFVLVGIVLWVAVLKSGVHATIAGVIVGLFIPMTAESAGQEPALERLLHALHPWIAFAILPLFAFANAGVDLTGMSPASLAEPVPLGIMLGLIVGKQLGVFGAAWLCIRTGIAQLPSNTSMAQMYGAAILAGVGFTMSLFISSLAFEQTGQGFGQSDRLAIIVGSLVCGTLGYLVLKIVTHRAPTRD